jgi:hypothetical protein
VWWASRVRACSAFALLIIAAPPRAPVEARSPTRSRRGSERRPDAGGAVPGQGALQIPDASSPQRARGIGLAWSTSRIAAVAEAPDESIAVAGPSLCCGRTLPRSAQRDCSVQDRVGAPLGCQGPTSSHSFAKLINFAIIQLTSDYRALHFANVGCEKRVKWRFSATPVYRPRIRSLPGSLTPSKPRAPRQSTAKRSAARAPIARNWRS